MAGVRMQKGDSLAVRAGNRTGMEQAETALLEICESCIDVLHGEADVVHPSPASRQEPGDRRVFGCRLQKLDPALANGQKGRLHLLCRDLLPMDFLEAESAVDVERVVNGNDGNADVVQFVSGHV
jgi:hypothetical protein